MANGKGLMVPLTIRPYQLLAISHFNLPGEAAVQLRMRKLFIACLLTGGLLQTAGAQTDVHGTWTVELHQGKVVLQVRSTPPHDWNRSGDWSGDWSMGQSYTFEAFADIQTND